MTHDTTDVLAEPQANALRAVFEAQFPYVFHTLRRLGVPERDLEDLTHEVFATFFRRIDAYDEARPIRPWLFGIAFRLASGDGARMRRAREELTGDHHPEPCDESPGADEQLDLERRRRLVLDALDTMHVDRKAILIMHDLDGEAMPNIAAALGISLNTGYSRLRLAREDFRSGVERIRSRGTR